MPDYRHGLSGSPSRLPDFQHGSPSPPRNFAPERLIAWRDGSEAVSMAAPRMQHPGPLRSSSPAQYQGVSMAAPRMQHPGPLGSPSPAQYQGTTASQVTPP